VIWLLRSLDSLLTKFCMLLSVPPGFTYHLDNVEYVRQDNFYFNVLSTHVEIAWLLSTRRQSSSYSVYLVLLYANVFYPSSSLSLTQYSFSPWIIDVKYTLHSSF